MYHPIYENVNISMQQVPFCGLDRHSFSTSRAGSSLITDNIHGQSTRDETDCGHCRCFCDNGFEGSE